MRRLLVISLCAAACLVLGGSASAQCASAVQRLLTDAKLDEARSQLQAQLKTNPSNDAALECMGRTYMNENKAGTAVDWFEKAVKANDNTASHHLWLGNALGNEAQNASRLRQPFLARRCKTEFERAVALDPTLVDARVSLVQFYIFAPGIMGGSADKADEQVKEIMKLNPMRGHIEAAWIAGQRKDSLSDEHELQAGERAAPDSAAPYLELGGFYTQHKRWDDAFAAYDKLIQLKPDQAGPHFYYGRTAALSGKNLERGEREMKYFVANLPAGTTTQTQAAAHQRLGMIYEAEEQKAAARAEYQTAVSLNSANEDAKKGLVRLR